MDPAVRAHYEKVRDLYDASEFAAEVDRRVEDAGGLLEPEVLALAIVDKEGRNEGAILKLADLEEVSEATVVVRVDRVFDVRTFTNDRGGGRVLNVAVRDATGAARLVLWNDDADLANDGPIAEGAIVRVANARVKRTSYGLELHVGRWSAVQPEDGALAESLEALPGSNGAAAAAAGDDEFTGDAPSPADASPVATAQPGDFLPRVVARVTAVEPTRAFRRGDGSTGFVAKARLEDDSGRGVLTAWDDHVKALQDLSPGDEVVLTDLSAREHRGQVELHTTRGTTMEPAED